jgi:hypothetical protein
MAVKEKLKFCPKSKILTDLPAGLEQHISDYVSKKYIFSHIFILPDKSHFNDSIVIKDERYPYFLKRCLLLYSQLTGRPCSPEDFGAPKNYSFTTVYKFPHLPPIERKIFKDSKDLLLKLPQSEFLPFSSLNNLRCSLSSVGTDFNLDQQTKNYSSLVSLLLDNQKFLFWYLEKPLKIGPGPLLTFLDNCNRFFDKMISCKDLNPESIKNRLEKIKNPIAAGLSPEDAEAVKLILNLLPPLDQPLDILAEYIMKFWIKLNFQHSNSLLEFLPGNIRDVPTDQADLLLSKFENSFKLPKDESVPSDDSFSDIHVYNSESYNYLIFKCLHSKARFHDPSIFVDDSDTFALEKVKSKIQPI